MKAFFVFLAFACLASSFASTSLKFPFDDEDNSLDNLRKKLEDSDVVREDSDIIITFPPIRTTIFPPRPRPTRPPSTPSTTTEILTTSTPTTTTTTTTEIPSSTTPSTTTTEIPTTTSTTTTTTRRPRPRPPRPTRPYPPRPSTIRPYPPRPSTIRPYPPRPYPPRPTSTTVRPPVSPNRNPQIFKNIFDKQDPFASRLYNFVQNLRGSQAIRQSNDIVYNIKFAKALKRLLDDEE